MEFIKNHFYKLTKEIPVKQLFQMPGLYHGVYYNIFYGNSNYSHVSPYESSSRFTIGRIYQAASKTSLYDDMTCRYLLAENEIECFEEVEIGLNEISKKFMEKQINSSKMIFQFNFFANNMVVLKMALNGKHSTWVSVVGVMGQVNEMLHNAYIALRKSYINKVKMNIETSYKWPTLMGGYNYAYDIETAARNRAFVGRYIY